MISKKMVLISLLYLSATAYSAFAVTGFPRPGNQNIPGCGPHYNGIPLQSEKNGAFIVHFNQFHPSMALIYQGAEYQVKISLPGNSDPDTFHFEDHLDTPQASEIRFFCFDFNWETPPFFAAGEAPTDVTFNLDGSTTALIRRFFVKNISGKGLFASVDTDVTLPTSKALWIVLQQWQDHVLYKVGQGSYDLHLHRSGARNQEAKAVEENMIVHYQIGSPSLRSAH